jgi:hypothetical protein
LFSPLSLRRQIIFSSASFHAPEIKIPFQFLNFFTFQKAFILKHFYKKVGGDLGLAA